MTIKNYKNIILDHLLESDSITYEDLGKFVPTSENRDIGVAACLSALQELSAANIVSLNPIANTLEVKTLIWNLTQSLESRKQTVELDGLVCGQISQIVNDFSETVEADIDTDFLNITQQDIMVLLEILSLYSQANNQKLEEEAQEEKSNKNRKDKQ